MPIEIERKFLVAHDGWRAGFTSAARIRQGYLCLDPGRTVRVRISGTQGWLTIKGPGEGASRAEFEYPLPLADATDLLDHLCRQPQIDKTRHLVPHGGLTFEVDVFHGDNEGLIMAEVELAAADTHVDLPPWIGAEVTGDHRYFNAYLAQHPFRTWSSHGL
jgi:adenylate cyclase